MDKPQVILEAWILTYRYGAPWFLSGFATGHPKLPGYRRFHQSCEMHEFDLARNYAETADVTYELRSQLEDLAIDESGTLRRASIHDLTAHRGDLRNEWFVSRGSQVVEHLWAREFYEVVPKLLALASRSCGN